jgi:NADH-ubiquinone oxidoreductase chain 6
MTDFLLTSLGLAIIGTSVLVVTAPSPVVSVLWLVALFMEAAGYMIVVGVPFVGLVYLVVYVGAVAVLFLFVILMLNVPLLLIFVGIILLLAMIGPVSLSMDHDAEELKRIRNR